MTKLHVAGVVLHSHRADVLRRHELLLDVRRGPVSLHSGRQDLLHRTHQGPELHFHRLGLALDSGSALGTRQVLLGHFGRRSCFLGVSDCVLSRLALSSPVVVKWREHELSGLRQQQT